MTRPSVCSFVFLLWLFPSVCGAQPSSRPAAAAASVPVPCRPVLRLIVALRTHNPALLLAQFTAEKRALLRKRLGIRRAFLAYKAAYKRDLGGVPPTSLSFQFVSRQGRVSLPPRLLTAGVVSVSWNGRARLHLRVKREGKHWRIESL